MVLKKPAAPAKKAAASKKAAPVKKAVRRSAKPEPEEVEEEEEEETEAEESGTIAEGTQDLVIRVHKSMTYACEGGLLDNATAYTDVTISSDMDLDDANAEMNRARALVALALGAQFTTTDETVLIGGFKPAAKPEGFGGGAKSSGVSGGARKASAVKKASKSRGGNRSAKSAHYDEDEMDALWTDFTENPKAYWDNTDPDENDYPSIKPKDNELEEIAERTGVDKAAGYLYLKSAPEWVKEHYGVEED